MKKPAFLFMIALLTFFPAWSQWQAIGPRSGKICNLKVQDGILYAGLNGLPYGIFASENKGKSWKRLGDLISDVNALYINDSMIYCGAGTAGGGRVQISKRSKYNWTFTQPGNATVVYAIREYAGKIYAATNTGLYRSSPVPNTWQLLYDTQVLRCLEIYKGKIYAAGASGIICSSDTGKSFQIVKATSGYSMETNGKMLLVGELSGPYGVLVSENGVNFTEYTSGLPGNSFVQRVQFEGDTMYAQIQTAAYRSVDTGKTWTKITTNITYSASGFMVYQGNVYFGSPLGTLEGGIFRFDAGSQIWRQVGLDLYNAGKIASDENYVYVGSARLESNGTWKAAVQPGTPDRELCIIDSVIYSLQNSMVYSSVDQGMNYKYWSNYNFWDLVKAKGKLIGTNYNYIWVTANKGKNWKTLANPDGIPLGRCAEINGRIVCSGRSEFDPGYYSDDTGNTWTKIIDTAFRNAGWVFTVGNVMIAQSYHSLFAPKPGYYLYKSRDMGLTWKPITNVSDNNSASDFIFKNGILFMSAQNGIFYSPDTGNSWTKLRTTGYTDTVLSATGITIKDSFLYASISYSGVWKMNISDILSGNVASVKLVKNNDFRLYPNPVSDILNILIAENINDNISIRISDITGAEILRKDLRRHSGTFNINLKTERLVPGYYIVQIQTHTTTCNQLLYFRGE